MNLSIGHLHSSIRLIELISRQGALLDGASLAKELELILICPTNEVIDIALKCNWIEASAQGSFNVSTKGQLLLSLTDYENRLRAQLKDAIIVFQPAWCKALAYGRKEFFRYVNQDIAQCFKESGLMYEVPSDSIIQWWDDVACISRGLRNSELLKAGRYGEKLTVKYEETRTGIVPLWQSIESNFSGFDILSVVSQQDDTPLQIEVKVSSQKMKNAKMHITQNEWRNANISRAHKFYLWLLGIQNQLAVLDVSDVAGHIPHNNGDGAWEIVEIPFMCYKSRFNSISL